MKNLRLAIVFFILLSIMHFTKAGAQNPTDHFRASTLEDSRGNVLPYRVLYPEDFNPEKKYPLVLFLHGAGERGDDNHKQLTHGTSLFLSSENRTQYPAVVVFPQCPQEEYWIHGELLASLRTGLSEDPQKEHPASEPMKLVMKLLNRYTSKKYIDTQRIYTVGLSMGAFGIFDLLSRKPDVFAAAIPICGAGDDSKAYRYAGKTEFWIFHGEQDNVVPVEGSRNMVQAITKAGGDPLYTEYPGVNHNSWDPAFAEEKLMQWLFSRIKP